MNKKWYILLLTGALFAALLASCGSNSTESASDGATDSVAVADEQESTSATVDGSAAATAYTVLSSTIHLSDYEANSVVTIDAAGEYVLSGTLSNGQVVVNVGDDDEVQLVLNNASITNNSGSALLVQNAGEVTITLTDGTNNTVADGSTYANLDKSGEPDAAILSHDDLTITGSGSLTVTANYSRGIESRDDLKITGGSITITAVDSGLFGNNSLKFENATVVITSGGDALHSDGDILIESGSLTLNSGDDAMHADGTLAINDGTIDILKSYEGLEATNVVINGGTIDIVSSDDGINGAGGNDSSGNPGGGRQDNFSGSQASITINGGTITIEAGTSGNGDGLDANGTIIITGGDTVIKMPTSYRDYTNIDYDTSISFTGGTVRILETNGTYTEVTASSISNQNHGRP